MIRIIALILLVAIVWKGVPFFAKRMLKSRRSQDVVRPLDDKKGGADV
jgi:hypothetical protein